MPRPGEAASRVEAGDVDERSLEIPRRFEIPMVIAALLVIPLIAIEQSDLLGEPWQTVGDVLNWGTWLAFALELVVMLIVVPNRWEWLRRNPLDVIVVF